MPVQDDRVVREEYREVRRPNPWPTVFGHHEFFHTCTLVAAICHHIAIYFALFA